VKPIRLKSWPNTARLACPSCFSYLTVTAERPNIRFELLRILSNALSAYALLEPEME
jgi:hypothetical protein